MATRYFCVKCGRPVKQKHRLLCDECRNEAYKNLMKVKVAKNNLKIIMIEDLNKEDEGQVGGTEETTEEEEEEKEE